MAETVFTRTTVLTAAFEDDHYMARVAELGLTAYGRTPRAAMAKLQYMYEALISHHQASGTMEALLRDSGLTWWREVADDTDAIGSEEHILAAVS